MPAMNPSKATGMAGKVPVFGTMADHTREAEGQMDREAEEVQIGNGYHKVHEEQWETTSSCSLSDSLLESAGEWHNAEGESGTQGRLGSRALVVSRGNSSTSDTIRSLEYPKSGGAVGSGTGGGRWCRSDYTNGAGDAVLVKRFTGGWHIFDGTDAIVHTNGAFPKAEYLCLTQSLPMFHCLGPSGPQAA